MHAFAFDVLPKIKRAIARRTHKLHDKVALISRRANRDRL
jgi:hypothetical protein